MSIIMIAEHLVDSYFDGSFAKFKSIDNLVDKIVDNIQEQELNAYQQFFKSKLEEFGVKSPNELDDEQKSVFFAAIKKGWKKEKK